MAFLQNRSSPSSQRRELFGHLPRPTNRGRLTKPTVTESHKPRAQSHQDQRPPPKTAFRAPCVVRVTPAAGCRAGDPHNRLVAVSIAWSGTSSHAFWPGPWEKSAFIKALPCSPLSGLRRSRVRAPAISASERAPADLVPRARLAHRTGRGWASDDHAVAAGSRSAALSNQPANRTHSDQPKSRSLSQLPLIRVSISILLELRLTERLRPDC